MGGFLPADGALAVGRTFGDGERLADLRLGETQREALQLEGLGELVDLVEVDSFRQLVAVGAGGVGWGESGVRQFLHFFESFLLKFSRIFLKVFHKIFLLKFFL